MAHDVKAKAVRSGLSLYANLLDPSSTKDLEPATISRAPVVFKQPDGDDVHQDQTAAGKQQINAASLRFQPTKRPQSFAQKPKPKPSTPRGQVSSIPVPPSESQPAEPSTTVARPGAKTTLADWTADGDEHDVGDYGGTEKRQRGGRKKRKKNKEESHVPQNWDDIYDPSRPNNYEDYKNSEEKIMEIREWKDRLYAHRMMKRSNSDSDDSSKPYGNKQPPLSKMSFAPPVDFETGNKLPSNAEKANVYDDPTGEDAYARRAQISQPGRPEEKTQQEPSDQQYNSPIPSSVSPAILEGHASTHTPPQPATQPKPPFNQNVSAPQSISRAPVRYNLPAAPSEIPASEADLEDALQSDSVQDESQDTAARSLRPGQKGFAERLMSKYGWSKGSGLGASGSGIVNPLRVQVEKQKKKPDSEGGGFVGPNAAMGKIVGGKRKRGPDDQPEEGKFGAMSEVVILRGMVDGMDLDAELEGTGDGGLMQEIGEECGEKYGRVERVFIDRRDPSKVDVFVKFTSQLSALRAVNALEGRIFNGNTIVAKFFSNEKFEAGIYE